MAKPIIPWLGGKRWLADKLLPLFPRHRCYVEPFAGAAALFFIKPPSKTEVINDINRDLINLYRVVQNHLPEFLRQFEWKLISREIFDGHQMMTLESLTDIQRAARFYYLQKLSFGAMLKNQNFGYSTSSLPRFNPLTIEMDLRQGYVRLARTTIECSHWAEIVERYDREHTLFYFDPPYFETQGYEVGFEITEYEKLAAMMRAMDGMAILTINDHPAMREIFGDLRATPVEAVYSNNGQCMSASELIIRNANAEKIGGNQGCLLSEKNGTS